MLVNDMKEKQTRHIDLMEVDPEVFKVGTYISRKVSNSIHVQKKNRLFSHGKGGGMTNPRHNEH